MTTNEQKCPVITSCKACGNYSKKGDWRICNLLDKAVDGSGINYLTERLPDCPFTVEKAAAVQEERERWVREVLAVANSVSMPYKSYLVIKDVLNNIKDEIG